jgi:hypothetical protein
MKYEELLLMIEGLPHTMKVPLRRAIKYAQKQEEFVVLQRRWIDTAYSPNERAMIWTKIEKKEKELEEMK